MRNFSSLPATIHYLERVFPFVAAAVPFAWLSFYGADSSLLSSLAAASHCALGALAVWLSGGSPARERPYALFAAGCLLAALAWAALPLLAPNPQFFVPDLIPAGLVKLGGYAASCILGFTIATRSSLQSRFQSWLIRLGLVFALLMLAIPVLHPDFDADQSVNVQFGRFAGTMLNPNAMACVSGMLALLGLGAVLRIWQRGGFYDLSTNTLSQIGAGSVLVLLSIGACARAQSRFTLALTLILAALLVVHVRRGRRPAIAIMALLITALPILVISAGGTIARFAALSGDAAMRFHAYRQLVRVLPESLWFGNGIGSFAELNTHLQTSMAGTTWDWRAAHNLALQALLEGGLPFTVLLAMAVGTIMMRIARGYAGWKNDPLLVAMGAAILLSLGCATIDIALNIPAVAAFVALLLGLLWGNSAILRLHPRSKRRTRRAIG